MTVKDDYNMLQTAIMNRHKSDRYLRFFSELQDLICKYEDVIDGNTMYLYRNIDHKIRKELFGIEK